MRPLISIPVIAALAVLVHLDWHVARPTHHRLSLGWEAHWTLCLAGFALAGWYLARRSPRAPWLAASLNAGLALFIGQIVEPLLEAAFYDGRLAFEVEPERWLAFGQCLAAAGLAMAAAVAFASGHREPRTQTLIPDP
jgi:hypothetical protein